MPANRAAKALTRGPGDPAAKPDTAIRQPFSGWRIVVLSSVALAMTAPGQTAGVSPFIDPVMADLGVTRTTVATAYLIGTLCGAAALPLVGRMIDRYGPRAMMVAIGSAFGAVLVAMSFATEVVGLTAGFVGMRLAGQGALGLTAVTVAAYWFQRRRGTALGIVSAAGAAGISLAPVLIERLIDVSDWRTAWLLEGLAVWAVVIPIAVFGIRNRPRDLGQHVDGAPEPSAADQATDGVSRAVALRTPYFWVLAAAVSVSAMLATAVLFHQLSLLGERGLTRVEAAANFVPQTVTGILATLLMGWLLDRYGHPRLLLAGSMGLLAVGLAWATVVSPGWSAIGYGATLGATGSTVRVLEATLTPRLFGTVHIGAIRGVLTGAGIAASALGPLVFAAAHQRTGAYTTALLAGIVLPLAVAVTAVAVRLPEGHRPT